MNNKYIIILQVKFHFNVTSVWVSPQLVTLVDAVYHKRVDLVKDVMQKNVCLTPNDAAIFIAFRTLATVMSGINPVYDLKLSDA